MWGVCSDFRCWSRSHRSNSAIRTRACTPLTNGKAERFIQSLPRERAYGIEYANSRSHHRGLLRWAACYNQRRPHCSRRRYAADALQGRRVNNVMRNDNQPAARYTAVIR
jgi:transposase InsO family protein